MFLVTKFSKDSKVGKACIESNELISSSFRVALSGDPQPKGKFFPSIKHVLGS